MKQYLKLLLITICLNITKVTIIQAANEELLYFMEAISSNTEYQEALNTFITLTQELASLEIHCQNQQSESLSKKESPSFLIKMQIDTKRKKLNDFDALLTTWEKTHHIIRELLQLSASESPQSSGSTTSN